MLNKLYQVNTVYSTAFSINSMKSIHLFFYSLLLIVLCGTMVQAQETYFNVPESDITEKNKILIQQQFSIQEFYRSLTTFNYGLGSGWEIGANLYNLDYYPDRKKLVRNDSTTQDAYSPLLLLNAQKVIKLNDQFSVGIGAQGGLNLTPADRHKFVAYGYANLAGSFYKEHYKASAGIYTGHVHYLGEGPRIGFQAGYDAGIFYQKLHLLGDWISGSHEVGQLTLGVEVFVFKTVPISLGWQRSNQNGASAFVIQFTYIPQE